jgi:hypothetical protein
MTDQELLISTLRKASRIIAEYLEPGPHDADEAITQLVAVLAIRTWHAPLIDLRRVTGCAW